jgi:hypothetical protein
MSNRKPKKRRIWTEQEKRMLIAAFEAQSVNTRMQYLKTRGVSSGWFYGMRRKMNATPATPAPVAEGGSLDSILADYVAAPRTGREKSVILKQYGINHQQMWDWRHLGRIPPNLRHLANGHSKALVTVPRGRPRRQAIDIPVFHLEPAAERAVTLDDAINVIQVKRDVYTEVIELLKHLKQ